MQRNRLASSDGQEGNLEHLGGGATWLPGEAEWLLADEGMLRETTAALRGELLDPLKTVVVHGALDGRLVSTQSVGVSVD